MHAWMMKSVALAGLVVCALAGCVQVSPEAGLPMAAPEEVGLSRDALARIGPAMGAYVEDGRLSGVMTMVARRGRVTHWETVGMRDVLAGDPLEPDDLFRIYSMTKPVTSVAAMILIEEGKIALDDPVSKYIPAFGEVKVLAESGDLIEPRRPMTIEHLLTHTSGLTYGFFANTPVDQMYRQSGFFLRATSLDDFVARVAELPLVEHPGERWVYSVSTDVLGRVIEIVSGRQLDEFLRERIFEPLGMEDTGFWVPPEKRVRFTANYRIEEGELRQADSPDDGEFTRAPGWLSGGGGLVSTASDYIRFAQMLLHDGQLDGVRILSEASARSMRSDHLPLGVRSSPGYGFGLGYAVLVDEEATPEPDNNGHFRWAGAANTFFWIDPETEVIGMVWTQIEPYGLYPIHDEFQWLVFESID